MADAATERIRTNQPTAPRRARVDRHVVLEAPPDGAHFRRSTGQAREVRHAHSLVPGYTQHVGRDRQRGGGLIIELQRERQQRFRQQRRQRTGATVPNNPRRKLISFVGNGQPRQSVRQFDVETGHHLLEQRPQVVDLARSKPRAPPIFNRIEQRWPGRSGGRGAEEPEEITRDWLVTAARSAAARTAATEAATTGTAGRRG